MKAIVLLGIHFRAKLSYKSWKKTKTLDKSYTGNYYLHVPCPRLLALSSTLWMSLERVEIIAKTTLYFFFRKRSSFWPSYTCQATEDYKVLSTMDSSKNDQSPCSSKRFIIFYRLGTLLVLANKTVTYRGFTIILYFCSTLQFPRLILKLPFRQCSNTGAILRIIHASSLTKYLGGIYRYVHCFKLIHLIVWLGRFTNNKYYPIAVAAFLWGWTSTFLKELVIKQQFSS